MAPPPSTIPLPRSLSPAPSFPSSPSSQAPSTIEDPTFSDISSLDDEDYELIDGRSPTALGATTSDLSASVEAVCPSWMTDSAESQSSLNESTTFPPNQAATGLTRGRQDSKHTAMQESVAHFDSEGGNGDSLMASTLLKPSPQTTATSSQYLNSSHETTGPSTMQPASGTGPSNGSSGASAMSSNWVLPDPTSPEGSACLGTQQGSSTPGASNATGAPTDTSGLQDSRLTSFPSKAWRQSLGASWDRSSNSQPASVHPQLSVQAAPPSISGTSRDPERSAYRVVEKAQEATEPDWARKTRAWLQLSNNDRSVAQAESVQSPLANSEDRRVYAEKSISASDDGLQGALQKGSRAAKRRIKLHLSDTRTRPALLHWIVAAFCGFMGAVVLLQPDLPAVAMKAAMTFPSGNLFSPLSRPNGSVAIAGPVSIDHVSTMQASQPADTKAASAASVPGPHDLLALVDDLGSEPVYEPSAEDFTEPPIDEDDPLTWGTSSKNVTHDVSPMFERLFNASKTAYYLLRSGAKAVHSQARSEWEFWKRSLDYLWFEVMEPAMKQYLAEVCLFISGRVSDISDAASAANVYAQAVTAAATRQTQTLLLQREALEEKLLKEFGPLYDMYFKEKVVRTQERASYVFDQIVKAADTLLQSGGEQANQAFHAATSPLDEWFKLRLETWSGHASQGAKQLSRVGQAAVSKSAGSMSDLAEELISSAARGKKAIRETLKNQCNAALEVSANLYAAQDAAREAARKAAKAHNHGRMKTKAGSLKGRERHPSAKGNELDEEVEKVMLRAKQAARKTRKAARALLRQVKSGSGQRLRQQRGGSIKREAGRSADRWRSPRCLMSRC